MGVSEHAQSAIPEWRQSFEKWFEKMSECPTWYQIHVNEPCKLLFSRSRQRIPCPTKVPLCVLVPCSIGYSWRDIFVDWHIWHKHTTQFSGKCRMLRSQKNYKWLHVCHMCFICTPKFSTVLYHCNTLIHYRLYNIASPLTLKSQFVDKTVYKRGICNCIPVGLLFSLLCAVHSKV